MNQTPETVTYKRARELWGLSEKTFQRLARAGEIDAVQYGSRVLLKVDSIRTYFDGLPPAYPTPGTQDSA